MMRALPVALVLALAACGASTTTTTTPPSTASASSAEQSGSGACTARAARDWTLSGVTYIVLAVAEGPSCAHATASLMVRAPDGRSLFADAYPTEQVSLAFSPHSDATALATELQAWIAGDPEHTTADQLPAWPEGAPAPPGFTPRLARIAYEGLRTEKTSILCYPDGGESNACIALSTNPAMVQRIGSLTPERR